MKGYAYCPHCGKKIQNDATFCEYCGRDVLQEGENIQAREITMKADRPDGVVVIKGIDMPFGSIVGLMVKWSLASIPAAIILFIIYGVLFAVFGSVITAMINSF